MNKKEQENFSLEKSGSTGLVRVGNSIEITNKIISEHEKRLLLGTYPTVRIGKQDWTIKNLDVEYYANGDLIPQVQNPLEWENLKTGAWCYYNNDPIIGKVFGKLYNWYAIDDKRGLAPLGFKIPTMIDWQELFAKLGNDEAGLKIKSQTGWKDNGNGTNESRFNLLPGGYRNYSTFFGINEYTHLWSSTEENSNSAFYVDFNFYGDNVFSTHTFKYSGFYVRCLRINK